MKRFAVAFAWVLVASLALAGASLYLRVQPAVTLAGSKEIRAAVPSELVQPIARDLAAEDRFQELRRLCRGLVKVQRDTVADATLHDHNIQLNYDRAEITTNQELIDSVDRLLAEGPIRSTPLDDAELQSLNDIRSVGKVIALDAQRAASDGDRERCEQRVLVGLKFAAALHEAKGDLQLYMTSMNVMSAALRSALAASRSDGLSAAAIRRVMAAIPPGVSTDPLFADACKAEFQQVALPWLSNVETQSKTNGSALVGRLDTLTTARKLGRVFEAGIQNSRRDWPHQDDRIFLEADKEASSLPNYEGSTSDGNPDEAGRWVRQLQFNATANSLGKMFLSGEAVDVNFGLQSAVKDATMSELVRSVLAIRLYSMEHSGVRPRALAELVKAGYLHAVPFDPYIVAPLRYSITKGLVYSVGPDKHDDGGNVTASNGTESQGLDFGYFVDMKERTYTDPPKPLTFGTGSSARMQLGAGAYPGTTAPPPGSPPQGPFPRR